jgi:PAS domain S-box-containing protein
MSAPATVPLHGFDEDAVLRTILEGTATETGHRFFYALVEALSGALSTHGAWVTEYLEEQRRLRALAFRMDRRWVEDYEFDIAGTPCETVIDQVRLIHFPDRLIDLYPCDPGIKRAGVVSYLGIPLLDVGDRVLGHMAVVDRRPIPDEPRVLALFRIFAARAAAELQRLRREAELRDREQKLARIVDGAMDAIIELDAQVRVTQVNPAAEQVFARPAPELIGRNFTELLDAPSHRKLARLIEELPNRPEGRQCQWIAGGLTVMPPRAKAFTAEATLARFEAQRAAYYTLVLRNVDARLDAERKIRTLTVEKEYLKEEIRELHDPDAILGASPALQAVHRDVAQVAPTDATVLLLGETGTGKELFARAIHAASPRRDHPLIKVNCAAIPAALIESEFFGHERGAFTGATQRRQGRFALADRGTIFLDEVGELPVDLQVKLLRVLQEGSLEPVGSSRTQNVDVRVLAATNRDLQKCVREGTFREDLYYRLNVFPIRLPPLRDRGDDVITLAGAFARRFAQKLGRPLVPLSEEATRRLKGYDWPGNVRELANVIERAVITAPDGRLDLERVLPETFAVAQPEAKTTDDSKRVLTAEQMQQLERENIVLALESTGGKVSGENGAARLLGINPSTLHSRMKALGIRRPRN